MIKTVAVPESELSINWVRSLGLSKTPETPVTIFAIVSAELLLQMPVLLKSIFDARHIMSKLLPVRDKSLQEVKEILETSFLGQSFFYIISDIEQFSKNNLPALVQYFMQYAGPHAIVIASSADFFILERWKGAIIPFPADMAVNQFVRFCAEWYPYKNGLENVRYLARKDQRISLNKFAISMSYAPVMSKSLLPVIEEQYMPRLMKSDPISFFSFSDLFWQKKAHLFYKQWVLLKHLYTEHFWITFWSDQLFCAFGYIQCMKHNQNTIAQQLAARKLSFFYIKTGWRSVDALQLINLHTILYNLDHTIKNGGTPEMIEYFYLSWFTAV